jgi:hypothetical protein
MGVLARCSPRRPADGARWMHPAEHNAMSAGAPQQPAFLGLFALWAENNVSGLCGPMLLLLQAPHKGKGDGCNTCPCAWCEAQGSPAVRPRAERLAMVAPGDKRGAVRTQAGTLACRMSLHSLCPLAGARRDVRMCVHAPRAVCTRCGLLESTGSTVKCTREHLNAPFTTAGVH